MLRCFEPFKGNFYLLLLRVSEQRETEKRELKRGRGAARQGFGRSKEEVVGKRAWEEEREGKKDPLSVTE